MKRSHNRSAQQPRPLAISDGIMGNADYSALVSLGNTRVLCAVSLTDGVPPFMRGKNQGWLTAEYSMLPAATHERCKREATVGKRNGRSVEISRLIGRSLRSITNLSAIGEKTIHIDCDVIQADGGTRTTALTGISYVLRQAEQQWLADGRIDTPVMTDELAAISVGLRGDDLLVDLDYREDSAIDADFNFVLTRSGNIIEIQGTAETMPLTPVQFSQMHECAQSGVASIFTALDARINNVAGSQVHAVLAL